MIWIQFHKYIQAKQHLTWLFTDVSKTLRSSIYFHFSNYNMYEFSAVQNLQILYWGYTELKKTMPSVVKVIGSAAVAATVTSHREGLCFTSLVSWSLSVDFGGFSLYQRGLPPTVYLDCWFLIGHRCTCLSLFVEPIFIYMVPNHKSCLKLLLLQGIDPKMFPYISVGNNGEVTLHLKS